MHDDDSCHTLPATKVSKHRADGKDANDENDPAHLEWREVSPGHLWISVVPDGKDGHRGQGQDDRGDSLGVAHSLGSG